MENLDFLFAAYSATWAVLFFYILSLWRRQSRVAKAIEGLEERCKQELVPIQK